MTLHRADCLAADNGYSEVLAAAVTDEALEQAVMLADMCKNPRSFCLILGKIDLCAEAALILFDDQRPAEDFCSALCGIRIALALLNR